MNKDIHKDEINEFETREVRRRKMEWRRKSWSIPDFRGGKQNWFCLLKELVALIGDGQANDLDEIPEVTSISDTYSWRIYAPFLKGIGLVNNQAGVLCLSNDGVEFFSNPVKRQLAIQMHDRIRLFGEVLEMLAETPLTVEEVDENLCELYSLEWCNLSNTRKRMDWLEVLDLIQGVGNRKWEATISGKDFLEKCTLVSPHIFKCLENDSNDIEIVEPPTEIAMLLRKLSDFPEMLKKRSTYNIWAPSPNRIDNLRIITQVASERIGRSELFSFIENKFHLKTSSAESMLPFLKASGLIEEVGRSVYLATPVAKAWLETGNDLDFIRILHSNMQFVGEMIRAAENDITRNSIYEQGKQYGLNNEKARWIVGFLVEAGLLEETQYLHLKATPMGMRFIEGLPLMEENAGEIEEKGIVIKDNAVEIDIDELEQIAKAMQEASCNPWAEGKAAGVAFEEAIAELFRYMGFHAERIGGAGDTDIVVKWKDAEQTITAIVDAKSKSNGNVSHSDISDVAIDTHKDKNKSDYVAIVGKGFSGDTIRNHAEKKLFALVTVAQLVEVANAFHELGLSLSEIALIFKVPNGISELYEIITSRRRELEIISIVVSRFSKEQDELGGLSPRDLFFILRDTELSPSLIELCEVFEILSESEIGILQATDDIRSPENMIYRLSGANKTVNRLRALASSIEKGLDQRIYKY